MEYIGQRPIGPRGFTKVAEVECITDTLHDYFEGEYLSDVESDQNLLGPTLHL
jgi:hypothetical protein